MKYSCPIVDVHASWLALNPIHGCPFSCKYCFMGGIGNTGRKPVVLCSPKEAIRKLLEFNCYNDKIPLCLFSSTDAFATKHNTQYAHELITELANNNVKNPIVFITKCYVPMDFIEFLNKMEEKGMTFIFFLSYSGLDNTIERGINYNRIQENFINLKKNNKLVIHYWRPFTPQNSTDERIDEVLTFVKKYALCSVIIGLKVQESYAKNLDFWPELLERKDEAINSEGVWTKNAYEKLYLKKYDDYKVFRSTSCALAYCLRIPDYNCYLDTYICKLNNCDQKQIEICKSKKVTDKDNLKNIIDDFFKKINKKIEYKIDNKTILLEGGLSTSEIVSLKYLTGYKIISKRNVKDHYWNTGHYEEKNLII